MKSHHISLVGVLAAAFSVSAHASAFTPGNLLIYRVGANSGSDVLANTGNAVFVDEWTTAGAWVQSVATGVFASGPSSSEGQLERSPDGRFVTFTGYATTNGSNLTTSNAATVNRTVSVVSASGAITTSPFSDLAVTGSPRSAVTTNGTDFWMVGSVGGVRYGTSAGGTSTQLSTAITNIRTVAVFADQLYVSGASGSAVRIGAVGSGLPTTSGQSIVSLPGLPTSTGSPYEFFLADLDGGVAGLDTLYYVDDTANAIGKYSLVGGTWVSNGTVAATAARGLAASVNGSTVNLFASTGGVGSAGSGAVYSLVDGGGYNAPLSGSVTTLFNNVALQTALGGTGSSYTFRGIELVPVEAAAIPEPSGCAALAGLAMLGLAAGRRRRD